MPIYQLTKELIFPDPAWATPTGLLAVGGDLSAERLLLAYGLGIFPWSGPEEPILWWSPPQRCIIEPTRFHVSRSLRRLLQQRRFTVTFDQAFPQVIHACAASRLVQQQQTWITPGMIEAYCVLHHLGFAHSAEAWSDERLVGGIYGVSLGSAFFGESMFKYETNASKVAFATLAQRLAEWQFAMIDCQMTNPHLLSLGAQEIPRSQFLRQLFSALSFPTRRGKWE